MKIAAILTTYNDEEFIPQFLRHYEHEVDRIFAVDNESSDRTIEILDAHPKVERSTYKTGGMFDHGKKNDVLNERVKACAGEFDYVLVLDCDELVVAKNKGPIRSVLEAYAGRPAFGTAGFNMYTYPWEAPYDPKLPLVPQRPWGVPSDYYSKPIVSDPRADLVYAVGRHFIVNAPKPLVDTREEALFLLLHYRGFDEALYVKRSLMKRDRNIPGYAQSVFASGTAEDFLARLRYERDQVKPVRVI